MRELGRVQDRTLGAPASESASARWVPLPRGGALRQGRRGDDGASRLAGRGLSRVGVGGVESYLAVDAGAQCDARPNHRRAHGARRGMASSDDPPLSSSSRLDRLGTGGGSFFRRSEEILRGRLSFVRYDKNGRRGGRRTESGAGMGAGAGVGLTCASGCGRERREGARGARAVPGERAGAVLLSCAGARGGFLRRQSDLDRFCAGISIWGGLGHEGRF